MTGVRWHSSAKTWLARKKGIKRKVVKVTRAMVGVGVPLRYTGSSPAEGGDIYIRAE